MGGAGLVGEFSSETVPNHGWFPGPRRHPRTDRWDAANLNCDNWPVPQEKIAKTTELQPGSMVTFRRLTDTDSNVRCEAAGPFVGTSSTHRKVEGRCTTGSPLISSASPVNDRRLLGGSRPFPRSGSSFHSTAMFFSYGYKTVEFISPPGGAHQSEWGRRVMNCFVASSPPKPSTAFAAYSTQSPNRFEIRMIYFTQRFRHVYSETARPFFFPAGPPLPAGTLASEGRQ